MPTSNEEVFAVVIGRFQPPHKGHVYLLKEAHKIAKKVIVVVGSAHQARDTRNPWTFEERAQMIALSFGNQTPADLEKAGIIITPAMDIPYNETAWVKSIQMAVRGIVSLHSLNPNHVKIVMVGLRKDITSYYLDMFPAWDKVEVPQEVEIDATSIREAYFQHIQSGIRHGFTHCNLTPYANNYLQSYAEKPEAKAMAEEWDFVRNYKQKWEHSPFPPVFVTVDAVVIKGGHVLLIRRRHNPGKGLLALPGGYIDVHEPTQASMLRELTEETRIKLSHNTLVAAIKKKEVYDYPLRSQRGRVITHAYLINLDDVTKGQKLPAVRGSNETTTSWYPLAAVRPTDLFEDHYHIIQDLLGING